MMEVGYLERSLKDLKTGEKAVIVRVNGSGAVKRRLMDMGVTSGTEILVRKVAPLGDPVEVNIRGYELSFRMSDAQKVIVE
jgi:ferrous iron transport protein A